MGGGEEEGKGREGASVQSNTRFVMSASCSDPRGQEGGLVRRTRQIFSNLRAMPKCVWLSVYLQELVAQ